MTTGRDEPEFRAEAAAANFLAGGGEMGRHLRAFDWRGHTLGPPAGWPVSLRTMVRVMLSTNHPVFIFWGPESICLYNDAYSRSLGPEKHPSMMGTRAEQAWAEIWPVIGPQIAHVLAGRGATWHENQRVPILRHGELQDVYWTYSYGPIDDADAPQGVGGVLVLVTETTAQVRAEQAQRAAEQRWRLLFEQAPGFLCVLEGPSHRYTFANARYRQMIEGRELVGRTVREAVPEAAEQGFIAMLDSAFASGVAASGMAMPLDLRRTQGEGIDSLHVDFVYQPISDAAGRVTGILVQGTDVTDRVRATAALAESEARYRALAEQLPGGAVFVVDKDLRYLMAAGEALAHQGVSSSALVGRTVAEVVAGFEGEALTLHQSSYRQALAGHAFETEHTAQGRAYLTRGVPLRDATGQIHAVLATSFDITDRRDAEDRLQLALARLNGVLSAAEVGTWIWDLDTDLIEQDLNLARMYGLGTATRSRPEQHIAQVHPDDRAGVRLAIEEVLAGRGPLLSEFRVRDDEGHLRWMAARGQLQTGLAGRPRVLAGIVIDISELKRLEESLRAADRQKGRFLAVLAHELRNPLAPLLSAAGILRSEALDTSQLAFCRALIERQVRHMAMLLDDLFDLSRIRHGRMRVKRAPVHLRHVVETAVEMVQPLLSARQHRLEVALPQEALTLQADGGRLAQVLANLLNNAAKYTHPGGLITLTATVQGATLEIAVADNGIGLSPEDQASIFVMFRQVESETQELQAGLGIGLSLVKSLVELHDGRIRVESKGLGQGSRFVLELPFSGSEASAATVVPAAVAVPSSLARRFLIVDDNADAGESLAMFFEMIGHTVRVAHSGTQAIEQFIAFRPEFAVIDIAMPGMNGYQVMQLLRDKGLADGVVCAALTGFAQPADKERARAAGFELHFTKPADPDELLQGLLQMKPGRAD